MRTCLTIGALSLLLAGCEKPQFTHREEFHQLEPYAQEYVEEVLDTYFGPSPVEMVIWNRLPLKLHLAEGTVTAATDRSLVLDLSEPQGTIAPGTEVTWVSGNLAGSESAWIRSWDESTGTAELDVRLATLPEEGSQVIVGPGHVLVRGRQLYAEHCQHCHGVSGDGAGSTAAYLNPRPRDYRRGVFKFTTTVAAERANREDLARTISEGIPGTYMPSFKLLSDPDMTSLVEYVMWLSMRGETEYSLVRLLGDGFSQSAVQDRLQSAAEKREAGAEDYETVQSIQQEFFDSVNNADELPAELEMIFELMISRWTSAQTRDALVAPKENRVIYDEQSIARGRQLYLSLDLNCIACHGEAGFGDGPQTYAITKDEYGNDYPEPGLYDLWGNPLEPRNLHTGIYRGGRRPIDLYARVHAGIKGTPMPSFGSKLNDQQIWDLVNYIYSVPYETVIPGAGNPTDPAAAAANEVATN